MSRAGSPSVQRKRIRDELDEAFADNANEVVAYVAEQFRPLYEETLARAVDAEALVERCLHVLNEAAKRGDRDASELINELLGAGYPIRPRWWQPWKRPR